MSSIAYFKSYQASIQIARQAITLEEHMTRKVLSLIEITQIITHTQHEEEYCTFFSMYICAAHKYVFLMRVITDLSTLSL